MYHYVYPCYVSILMWFIIKYNYNKCIAQTVKEQGPCNNMDIIIVLKIRNQTENLTQNFLEAKTKLEPKLHNSYLLKVHRYSQMKVKLPSC